MPPTAGPAATPRKHPPSRTLKAGQRLPTEAEKAEATAEEQLLLKGQPAGFTWGCAWEINARAASWDRHNFAGRRGNSDFFRSGIDPSQNEIALLMWDLDLWRGMPAHERPPLASYLRNGREHWGWLGPLVRAYRLMRKSEEQDLPDDVVYSLDTATLGYLVELWKEVAEDDRGG